MHPRTGAFCSPDALLGDPAERVVAFALPPATKGFSVDDLRAVPRADRAISRGKRTEARVMQRSTTMNASNLVHTIGSSTGAFAKRVGSGTADLASKVGSGTASLARTIGPKRGLIGLALIGGAIAGGIIVSRYLKRRSLERESMEASDEFAPTSKRNAQKNGKNHKIEDAVTY